MERFDLYTGERVVTGETVLRGDPIPKGYKHLVIFICVFNSDGKLLIQKRQSTKKMWPGMWDVSVGGCVSAGETSQEAAHRETLEEIGADIDFSGEYPRLTIHYDDCMNDVYVVRGDYKLEELTPQPEEVEELRWATLEEIYELLDEGKFIGVHRSFLEMMFDMRDQVGILT